MTQYVRGLTPPFREYWLNLINTEIIPVKDGNPKLSFKDRLLGRKKNAYYVLDVKALDRMTYEELVNRLASKYDTTTEQAEKWLKDYRIPARLVEKVDVSELETCITCGSPIPEKGINFCPKCGSKLKPVKTEYKPVVKPRIIEQSTEAENATIPSPSTVMQIQQVKEELVSIDELAVRMQEFKITWSKVLLFLEEMHKSFNLESIRFNNEGKPVVSFRSRRRTPVR